jgi:LacI family transcriptional regulator
MAVTIKDVAKQAGVAVGTVSRVINGRADVNPELRAKVEDVIRELAYRPNLRARNLSRKASPILSFILSNRSFVHPFHSHVLEGVERHCSQAGYFVLFTKFDYSPATSLADLRLPDVLMSHGVADCVIAAGTNHDNFLDALDRLGMKYVVLGNNLISDRERPPEDRVRFDEVTGAWEATRYLIQLGHRQIWFVGDTSMPWCRARHIGYTRAMNDASLEPHAFTAGLSDDHFLDGLRSVESLVEQKVPISAILAGTDEVAYGAWEALQRKGFDVPGDVSLVGFDDQLGAMRTPQLTSVRVDTERLGRELAKMAIEKIENAGAAVPEVVLPAQLQRRGTCRPLFAPASD